MVGGVVRRTWEWSTIIIQGVWSKPKGNNGHIFLPHVVSYREESAM